MININKADRIVQLYTEKFILASQPSAPLWNCENRLFSKPSRWNYMDGCMIRALLMLYELTGKPELLDYACRFTDYYVTPEGKIPTMNPLDFNLDNINGGKNLIYLWRKTGCEHYRAAFENIYNEQLLKQPRLKCGNFYHKAVYPSQIWLDGIYMALPFMAEYSLIHGDEAVTADILNQLRNVRKLMRDTATGLYYHGYDEIRSSYWADKKTGLSSEFWLRSIGWYCAALADLCEIFKSSGGEIYRFCESNLNELLSALCGFIGEDNMLYQLPARRELKENYPETSGTLLFAYSALKAQETGIGDAEIWSYGKKAFDSVTENFIDIDSSGLPVLKNICLVAGLGGPENRDGTAEYYLGEPYVENEAKGIAPYIMAAAEMKKLYSSSSKKAVLNSRK
ncbi:MAG: glycoside hydrolase family 105 protein [Ruminococcus sp.]